MICKYCNHKFFNEVNFNKHKCDGFERTEFIKTPKGLACFNFYSDWLKLSKYATHVTTETFINSRYYNSFIRFVDYGNRMLIPNKYGFIKFMVSKNMLPTYWCNDQVYIEYIKNLDINYPPTEQIKDTVKTIYELSSIYNCNPTDVIDNLDNEDFVLLIRTRKLSPWLLLFSKKFHEYLKKLSKDDIIIIENIINPNLWRNKFNNYPNDVEYAKNIIKSMNL